MLNNMWTEFWSSGLAILVIMLSFYIMIGLFIELVYYVILEYYITFKKREDINSYPIDVDSFKTLGIALWQDTKITVLSFSYLFLLWPKVINRYLELKKIYNCNMSVSIISRVSPYTNATD